MKLVELGATDIMVALEVVVKMMYDAKKRPDLLKLLTMSEQEFVASIICTVADSKLAGEESAEEAAAVIEKAKGGA